VHAIGARKNERVKEIIESDGVRAYPDAVALIEAARTRGVPCALVSSSANARAALRSVGLDGAFAAWVDGVRIAGDGLAGKPAPDAFLAAARDLGVAPGHATVLEDAPAGVAAGRAGGFGCVVGVDRTGDRAAELREQGADIVLTDLTRLDLGDG
jgi:HAD superfamily hydrolase (TIGR01509 family)